MKVWLDGQVVDSEQARIPVTDHGLLYGDGVFEGIRVYTGRIFQLPQHLERMERSARAIGLELPHPPARLREIVCETASAFGKDEAYLRLLVTRGSGPLGVDPTACSEPRTICIAADAAIYSREQRARGLNLITASLRRPAADALDPRVKSLNYLNSVLAKREARLRGADEALILNAQGRVAEAAVANLFALRGGKLRTPSEDEGLLSGLTRARVPELASAQGVAVVEAPMERLELLAADEVFLTGTGVSGVVGVRSLDGHTLGNGEPGPVTRKLARAFSELVAREGVPLSGLSRPVRGDRLGTSASERVSEQGP